MPQELEGFTRTVGWFTIIRKLPVSITLTEGKWSYRVILVGDTFAHASAWKASVDAGWFHRATLSGNVTAEWMGDDLQSVAWSATDNAGIALEDVVCLAQRSVALLLYGAERAKHCPQAALLPLLREEYEAREKAWERGDVEPRPAAEIEWACNTYWNATIRGIPVCIWREEDEWAYRFTFSKTQFPNALLYRAPRFRVTAAGWDGKGMLSITRRCDATEDVTLADMAEFARESVDILLSSIAPNLSNGEPHETR